MEQKHPIHRSFGFALKGISIILKERNFKIQLVAAIVTIGLGFFFHISTFEWASILICMVLVLSLEMINTAIEKTIDLLHPHRDQKAAIIKDISAGAVLVAAIISAIVGGIIFVPKVMAMLNS